MAGDHRPYLVICWSPGCLQWADMYTDLIVFEDFKYRHKYEVKLILLSYNYILYIAFI